MREENSREFPLRCLGTVLSRNRISILRIPFIYRSKHTVTRDLTVLLRLSGTFHTLRRVGRLETGCPASMMTVLRLASFNFCCKFAPDFPSRFPPDLRRTRHSNLCILIDARANRVNGEPPNSNDISAPHPSSRPGLSLSPVPRPASRAGQPLPNARAHSVFPWPASSVQFLFCREIRSLLETGRARDRME